MASLSVMLLKILAAVHATCDAHAFPLALKQLYVRKYTCINKGFVHPRVSNPPWGALIHICMIQSYICTFCK